MATDHDLPTLAEIERTVIRQRLKIYRWNKTRTALSLGISLKTLYNRMHDYGMPMQPPPPKTVQDLVNG